MSGTDAISRATEPAPGLNAPAPRRDAIGMGIRALRGINVLGIGFMLFLACAWELADRAGYINFEFLPRPLEIVAASGDLIRDNELLPNVAHTLKVTLSGWFVAVIIGLTMGIVLGLWRPSWTYGMATVELFRALPSITLVPISVLVFGFSMKMELVLVIFASQWPVMVSTIDGLSRVSPGLRDTGATMRLTRREVLTKIMIPSALPVILVGLRLALTLALILAVAAEMIGNPAGLGYALVSEQEALRPDRMFVYFITVGFIGVGLNAIFVYLARIVSPGSSGSDDKVGN